MKTKLLELWETYNHIFNEIWFWNIVFIIVLILWGLFYSHMDYIKLKKLWKKHSHHNMAAHIMMNRSGIFTKYWVRTFVRGAERWFS